MIIKVVKPYHLNYHEASVKSKVKSTEECISGIMKISL